MSIKINGTKPVMKEPDDGRNIRIFVYGSLMRGLHNHAVYLSDARFLGEAQTPPCYTLYSLGAFPGLVQRGVTAVKGEVWMVNRGELAAIDRLEGHPRFYMRQKISLADHSDAWCYLLDAEKVRNRAVVKAGDWRRRVSSRIVE